MNKNKKINKRNCNYRIQKKNMNKNKKINKRNCHYRIQPKTNILNKCHYNRAIITKQIVKIMEIIINNRKKNKN